MFARRTNASPKRMVKAMVRLAGTPQQKALHELARSLHSPSPQPVTVYDTMRWCFASPSAGWLTHSARSFTVQRVEQASDSVSHYEGPGQYHEWLNTRRCVQHSMAAHAVAASCGLKLDMPYLDSALVDTCFALPTYARAASHLQYKPLLTAALPELPEVLKKRTTKGSFDATFSESFRQSAEFLRKVVGSSQLIQEGILRSEPVRNELEEAIAGVTRPSAAIQQLVAIELWLKTRDLRFETWWEKA